MLQSLNQFSDSGGAFGQFAIRNRLATEIQSPTSSSWQQALAFGQNTPMKFRPVPESLPLVGIRGEQYAEFLKAGPNRGTAYGNQVRPRVPSSS
jgi:hypothetical protein